MAQKKPIANYTGALQELSAGDTIDPALLGGGTRDGTKFLRDDGTYQIATDLANIYAFAAAHG